MEARIRELEKAAPREVIDVDAAAENTMVIFSAIEELRKDTEEGWKKLAVPLDQVIKANNGSNVGLKKRLSVDDLVYHGSLVAFHKNQLDRRADDMPLNDTALYHLINVGVRDMDAIDKPWDASTRSMRYAACLGDRLWSMITREQNRVCVFRFFVLLRN